MILPLRLRVFLSSPSDVADERAIARQVLEQLPYDPLSRGKISFDVVAWDQPKSGVPMFATMTPQEAVNQGLPKPSECDIVVVVLWARMGTPLPQDTYHKSDGKPFLSGTEWEYWDAVNAHARAGRPEVLVYRRTEKCLLDQDDAAYDEKRTQYQRVKAFFESFRNPDGSHKRAHTLYDAPEDFRDKLDANLRHIVRNLMDRDLRSSLLDAAAPVPRPPLWPVSPFPGLRAFTPADAPIFFGRGREADALVRRLSDPATRLVAVVGASGSGKSSLVAAGLLPRLKTNAIEGSKDWLLPDVIGSAQRGEVVVEGERKHWTGLRFTPAETGDDPFLALAVKLVPLLPDNALKLDKLTTHLKEAPGAIERYLEDALRARPHWAELVLFIDQLEELFTVIREGDQAPFVELLAAAAETPRVRTVATLRADFYHRSLELPRLAELLRETSFPLAAPGAAARVEMVSRPATRAGLDFEDGLLERILEDTGTDAGALSLLAFALHELYKTRTPEGRLTHAAYDGFGGVRGAVSERAETTFKNLSSAAQSELHTVFRDLVDVNEQGTAIRRRGGKLAAIGSSRATKELVDAFIDARLLVTDRAPDGTSTVEVSHDALLREWKLLDDWIRDFFDDLRTIRQAEAAAVEWCRMSGTDRKSFLWPHERLVLVHEALSRVGGWESRDERTKFFLRPEAERLLEEIDDSETSHERRAVIGERLDYLKQHRDGVGVCADTLPDILWCDVPPGTVTLEENGGTAAVKPFQMSRYPVTNAQFNSFVDAADGYQDARWWHGMPNKAAKDQVRARFSGLARPRDNVSWYEAVAFCRWLSHRLLCEVSLPTEFEWQQAATGADPTRIYPWGPKWDPDRCNSSENELNRTTAVGMYPRGASPDDVHDLAGNVWEWCLNKYDRPTETGVDVSDDWRSVRGGSWLDSAENCRGVSRQVRHAHLSERLRGASIGFRVIRRG